MLVPPPDRRNGFAQRLFAPLPSRYDRLAELLSFGQNGRWRRAMVDHLVPAGREDQLILDVAAGTAGISLQLARAGRRPGRRRGPDRADAAAGARNVSAAGQADRVRS